MSVPKSTRNTKIRIFCRQTVESLRSYPSLT